MVEKERPFLYADDASVVSRTIPSLENMMVIYVKVCRGLTLMVSEAKTGATCKRLKKNGEIKFDIKAAGHIHK